VVCGGGGAAVVVVVVWWSGSMEQGETFGNERESASNVLSWL